MPYKYMQTHDDTADVGDNVMIALHLVQAKCHKYWPEKGERQTHDGITVIGEDVQLRADFYIRSFQIHKAKVQ